MRKLMAGWYAQRTEGAHGRFETVNKSDLPGLMTGIREFMIRHLA
jgi:hypothetical protein